MSVAWERDENLGFEWRRAERVDQRHRDSDDGPAGVSREAANHPGPPANLNYVSGRHTLAGFFLLLPYCYLSDDLPVT